MVRDYGLTRGDKIMFNRCIKHRGLRMCWGCGVVLPLVSFRAGYSTCTSCRSAYTKVHYTAHREEYLYRSRAIDHRATYAANSSVLRARARDRSARHPKKMLARTAVSNAVSSGKVNRPTNCSQCGHGGSIEAHHTDYSKPLLVVWLCRACHRREHSEYT